MKITKVNGGVWCTVCLKDLAEETIWISDDIRDGRLFCYDCAPDDAIRYLDTIQPDGA